MSFRRTVARALPVVISFLVVLPGNAETRSASMQVSVQVIPRAVVTIEAEPHIVVTPADVANGYVDVPQPLHLRVRTNSPAGYLLQVAKTNDAFAAVELEFGDTMMNITQESWVARPRVTGGDIVTVRLRLRLGSAATAGRHALPIEVSALPL